MGSTTLVWKCEERPDLSIETKVLKKNESSAVIVARIKNEKGRTISTSALFGLGKIFVCDEQREGDRLAKTPASEAASDPSHIETPHPAQPQQGGSKETSPAAGSTKPKSKPAPKTKAQKEKPEPPWTDDENKNVVDLADYKMTFGKKYKGKTLRQMTLEQIRNHISYLENARHGLFDEQKQWVWTAKNYLSQRETKA